MRFKVSGTVYIHFSRYIEAETHEDSIACIGARGKKQRGHNTA